MSDKNNKKHPEDQAAQYLANLMGKNVAGFEPQPVVQYPSPEQILNDLLSGKRGEKGFDIEKCLSNPSDWPWKTYLPYLIMAYILHADNKRKVEVLTSISPEIFNDKFARFLFLKIRDLIQEDRFSIEEVQRSIECCGQIVFGYELTPILKLSLYSRWFKTLATEPSVYQFSTALTMLQEKGVNQE